MVVRVFFDNLNIHATLPDVKSLGNIQIVLLTKIINVSIIITCNLAQIVPM